MQTQREFWYMVSSRDRQTGETIDAEIDAVQAPDRETATKMAHKRNPVKTWQVLFLTRRWASGVAYAMDANNRRTQDILDVRDILADKATSRNASIAYQIVR